MVEMKDKRVGYLRFKNDHFAVDYHIFDDGINYQPIALEVNKQDRKVFRI